MQTKRGTESFERTLRNEMTEDVEAGRDAFAGPCPFYRDFARRWTKNYVEVNNRPSTVSDHKAILKNHLLPAVGHLRLDEVTTAHIDSLASRLKRAGRTSKTINNIMSVLRCSLAVAHDWGELRVIPKVRWQKAAEQPYRYLTPVETARLLAATDDGFWHTFLLVLLHTGMRFGEAAGLRWEDVDLEPPNPTAHVRRAVSRGRLQPTKTGRLRDIPLTTEVVSALQQLPRRGDLIFPRQDGRPMNPGDTNFKIKKFCRVAGIAPSGWHMTRHTFATTLMAASAPIRAVQELLGHTTIQMTARYAHVAPSTLRNTIDILGNSD